MPDTGGSTTACTIVARNYLPAARVLAESYLRHHPGSHFVVAVIDGDRPYPDGAAMPGARLLGPDALGIDRETFLRMATAYTVMELATAVKPFLLRTLRSSSDVVVYLDPDIEVYSALHGVIALAAEHGIVLTPHNLEPMPRDGKEPDEAVIMGTGVFNLGFVAVGPGSEPFLDFWAQRLERDAVVAPEQQLFTDQRWVDCVPGLFGHHVARDPGLNVAYWNAWERPLSRDADATMRAAGEPLRFVHFSGYRPERPWLLSSHCARDPRVLLSDYPMLRELCDGYGWALRAAGYGGPESRTPYRYAATPEGEPLTGWMRRAFRAGWAEAERAGTPVPPHPFGSEGGEPFLRWLASPADPRQAAAGLTRPAMQVWARRADLQRTFPDPTGTHAVAFRRWCHGSGVAEGELPVWALPAEVAPARPPVDELGVNLVGYLTAELGLGEMGRIVHDALEDAGVPTASVVEDWSVSNRTGLPPPVSAGDPVFPVTLLCINADQTRTVLGNHPEIAHQRYVIGLWAWELEDFPQWQHEAFDLVDEVWTVSEFCRAAIAAHASVPVRTIPVPVREVPEARAQARPVEDVVRFLFVFDFNSVGERKNPWGLVEAFRRAFPNRQDAAEPQVRLIIKAINADRHPHAAERLRLAAAGDDRVELLERYLSAGELDRLYGAADCYVSLHRSEGFGLTVAEAMARGLPTIVTGYSGTAEFTTAETGWSVGYELVPVGVGCFPYHPEAEWAAPDLDEAARAMRAVAEDPAAARRRGAAARAHLQQTRPMAAASAWVSDRLREAHRRWQQRSDSATEAGPLTPLESAREALRWRADTSTPSRLPLARPMRAAVLRAMDHYDVHQRTVQAAVLDGVAGGMAALLDRVESLHAELLTTCGELSRQVGQLTERLAVSEQDLGTALQGLAGQQRRVEALEARVEEESKRTHALFLERDRRVDHLDTTCAQLERDTAALVHGAERPAADVPVGATPVLCDAGVLLFPADDQVVRAWVVYHRSWESPEADLLERLARGRHGTFLDVGAHVGYHTVRLLDRLPGVRAVAVEPNPAVLDMLRANLAAAGIDERVTVLPVAAWDHDTAVGLHQVETDNSGDYRVVPDGALRVDALRLDTVAAVISGEVAVVKVDLQGRDHRAIAGLDAVLQCDRPDVVCEFCPDAIEELGDDPHQVLEGYRAQGYAAHDVDGTPQPSAAALVQAARGDPSRFRTLWLRPA